MGTGGGPSIRELSEHFLPRPRPWDCSGRRRDTLAEPVSLPSGQLRLPVPTLAASSGLGAECPPCSSTSTASRVAPDDSGRPGEGLPAWPPPPFSLRVQIPSPETALQGTRVPKSHGAAAGWVWAAEVAPAASTCRPWGPTGPGSPEEGWPPRREHRPEGEAPSARAVLDVPRGPCVVAAVVAPCWNLGGAGRLWDGELWPPRATGSSRAPWGPCPSSLTSVIDKTLLRAGSHAHGSLGRA